MIKIILIIIVAVVVLGYFNIDLRSVWNSETVQNNLGFIWNGTKTIWNDYLKEPATFVWGAFYNYIWLAFVENMERIKDTGEVLPETVVPTFEGATPATE